MFTDLGILEHTVSNRSEIGQTSDEPTLVDVPSTSIRRKLPHVEASRDHQIYTRAWAIYSRARTRQAVRAFSII